MCDNFLFLGSTWRGLTTYLQRFMKYELIRVNLVPHISHPWNSEIFTHGVELNQNKSIRWKHKSSLFVANMRLAQKLLLASEIMIMEIPVIAYRCGDFFFFFF